MLVEAMGCSVKALQYFTRQREVVLEGERMCVEGKEELKYGRRNCGR